jgi:hypothetical protein
MLKTGQASFFGIIGIFMIIIVAGMLATTWKMGQGKLDTELAKQSTLREDKLLLEWQADIAIRNSALEAINKSNVTKDNIEAGIARLFSTTQFTRRGAEIIVGYPSVRLATTGKYLIVDADFPVKVKRTWGEAGIEPRSIKVAYNGTAQ